MIRINIFPLSIKKYMQFAIIGLLQHFSLQIFLRYIYLLIFMDSLVKLYARQKTDLFTQQEWQVLKLININRFA